MIKVILWDIDATLLNFEIAEKTALQKCFNQYGLGKLTDELLERYIVINKKYWKQLERQEISKEEVLIGRFKEFFTSEHMECSDIGGFNDLYQVSLGETICFNDHGYELVKELKKHYKQYAVTNGTYKAQDKKLTLSGLYALFDGVFISEKIGIEKPNIGFFDYVFNHIGHYAKEEIIIVGDSLTSDMRGGNNAGITTIWYNPTHMMNDTDVKIDFEIENLNEIKSILEKKEG